MAWLNPPTWLENSDAHNAVDYRTMLASLVPRSGVAAPDALAVTEKSGTADMSVDVAGGGVFIASTRGAGQGTYHAYNDGTVNVALSASDPTNPRIDRIIVQVRDEAQDPALTQNDVRLLVVEGTPSASPSAPTVTVDDYVELAQVTVPASASAITDATIDDQRDVAAASGGTIVCTSTTRPSSPRVGQAIFEIDKNRELIYDGTYWRLRGIGTTRTDEAPTLAAQTADGGVLGTTTSWTPDYIGVAVINVDAHLDFDSSGANGFVRIQRSIAGGAFSTVKSWSWHDMNEQEGHSVGGTHLDSGWTPGSSIRYRVILAISTGSSITLRSDSNFTVQWEGR